ncbi:hypothetical protein HK105_206231 [Polyrhizophydium stewartii]|uniref:Uncharacterized protein n=1 Tax=Polyrhizophydium stewartii TaxID=2732419 RepID=A0ABR4N479_9FUNG
MSKPQGPDKLNYPPPTPGAETAEDAPAAGHAAAPPQASPEAPSTAPQGSSHVFGSQPSRRAASSSSTGALSDAHAPAGEAPAADMAVDTPAALAPSAAAAFVATPVLGVDGRPVPNHSLDPEKRSVSPVVISTAATNSAAFRRLKSERPRPPPPMPRPDPLNLDFNGGRPHAFKKRHREEEDLATVLVPNLQSDLKAFKAEAWSMVSSLQVTVDIQGQRIALLEAKLAAACAAPAPEGQHSSPPQPAPAAPDAHREAPQSAVPQSAAPQSAEPEPAAPQTAALQSAAPQSATPKPAAPKPAAAKATKPAAVPRPAASLQPPAPSKSPAVEAARTPGERSAPAARSAPATFAMVTRRHASQTITASPKAVARVERCIEQNPRAKAAAEALKVACEKARADLPPPPTVSAKIEETHRVRVLHFFPAPDARITKLRNGLSALKIHMPHILDMRFVKKHLEILVDERSAHDVIAAIPAKCVKFNPRSADKAAFASYAADRLEVGKCGGRTKRFYAELVEASSAEIKGLVAAHRSKLRRQGKRPIGQPAVPQPAEQPAEPRPAEPQPAEPQPADPQLAEQPAAEQPAAEQPATEMDVDAAPGAGRH